MVTPQNIKQWIVEGLENSDVTVDGDGRHFDATIICSQFEGKSLVQRHQMIYGLLGDKMKSDIHALSMKTLTPGES